MISYLNNYFKGGSLTNHDRLSLDFEDERSDN